MTKLNAGLITSLPASDPGSAAVWGSKRINPRPQFCLCLAWSGCPSNDDDDDDDQWLICVDLKMVNFLLGQQGGHTKYSCFLCYWDSRTNEEHLVRKKWPARNTTKPGEKNIVNNPLVNRKNIILPPLHIKLGLMKQFFKALDRSGDCFGYICSTFPGLSYEKRKAGIFDEHRIRTLLRDQYFVTTITVVEARA